MNFSKETARASKVWFDTDNLWILFVDGRQLSVPKSFFPSFVNATEEQLSHYELSGGGIGIHWDSLDEDLYVPNLLINTNMELENKYA